MINNDFSLNEINKINKNTLQLSKEVIKKTYMSDKKYLKKYFNKEEKDLNDGIDSYENNLQFYARSFILKINKFVSPSKKAYDDNQFYICAGEIINYPMFINLLKEAGIVFEQTRIKDVDSGEDFFDNTIIYKIDRFASREKENTIKNENKYL